MSSANKHRKACQFDKQRSNGYHVEYRNTVLGKHHREEFGETSLESSVHPDPAISPLLHSDDPVNCSPEDDSDLEQCIATRKRARTRNLPLRFRDGAPDRPRPVRNRNDILPQDLAGLPPPNFISAPTCSSRSMDEATSRPLKAAESSKNSFGLFRRYLGAAFPSHDPDTGLTAALSRKIDGRVDSLDSDPHPATSLLECDSSKLYGPYPNETAYVLGSWQNNGNTMKSKGEFMKLVTLLKSGAVKPYELHGVNWDDIDTCLARKPDSADGFDSLQCRTKDYPLLEGSGWQSSLVKISIPYHSHMTVPGCEDYEMRGFLHRRIVDVIKEVVQDSHYFSTFHVEPYELFWQPNTDRPPIRVHGELYSSKAFLDAHRQVRDSPGEPGCKLERVVAALMFASDATHLTQFGEKKLWPCYLMFGNNSKYLRLKPTNNLFEVIAFFEQVGLNLVCLQSFRLSHDNIHLVTWRL